MRTHLRAFTLIELLIVIAIIAILALIAIPNFLEAQTRSKVARAQSDMRTIATAVEAYYVDYNNYFTLATDDTGYGKSATVTYGGPTDNFQRYSSITTPVAYITSLPRDPFSKVVPDVKIAGWRVPALYLYHSGNQGQAANSTTREVFAIVSKGPDLQTNLYNLWNTDQQLDVNEQNTDWTFILAYDATNGTISRGDIARTGGGHTTYFPTNFYWKAPNINP
ncbi:MAG: prepilin-type N-terminal cleavage/methylation domain-containing protein [Candidatus Sumerlaeota bacterium]|nr:prepilin-type N-terminal cleavage/methylation domain-containing protein [Candidatus Sumerlaeota bacterium]